MWSSGRLPELSRLAVRSEFSIRRTRSISANCLYDR
jgi:hypothetical protein